MNHPAFANSEDELTVANALFKGVDGDVRKVFKG